LVTVALFPETSPPLVPSSPDSLICWARTGFPNFLHSPHHFTSFPRLNVRLCGSLRRGVQRKSSSYPPIALIGLLLHPPLHCVNHLQGETFLTHVSQLSAVVTRDLSPHILVIADTALFIISANVTASMVLLILTVTASSGISPDEETLRWVSLRHHPFRHTAEGVVFQLSNL